MRKGGKRKAKKKKSKKRNPKDVGHFLVQIVLPAARWICVWWYHRALFIQPNDKWSGNYLGKFSDDPKMNQFPKLPQNPRGK